MTELYIGNKKVNEIYAGNNIIEKVYKGSNLIYKKFKGLYVGYCNSTIAHDGSYDIYVSKNLKDWQFVYTVKTYNTGSSNNDWLICNTDNVFIFMLSAYNTGGGYGSKQIIRSEDGYNWSKITINNVPNESLSLINCNNEFFIGSRYQVCSRSVDGINWTTFSNNSEKFYYTDNQTYLGYTPGNNSVLYSTDKTNWTSKNISVYNVNEIINCNRKTIYYLKGKSDYSSTYNYSNDGGLTWQQKSFPESLSNIWINKGKTKFYLYGLDSNSTQKYYESLDGINWSVSTLQIGANSVYYQEIFIDDTYTYLKKDTALNNNIDVKCEIYRSFDETNWTKISEFTYQAQISLFGTIIAYPSLYINIME